MGYCLICYFTFESYLLKRKWLSFIDEGLVQYCVNDNIKNLQRIIQKSFKDTQFEFSDGLANLREMHIDVYNSSNKQFLIEDIRILICSSHINRGVLLIQLDRKEELINDYSKAIEINPKNAILYHDIGIIISEREYQKLLLQSILLNDLKKKAAA